MHTTPRIRVLITLIAAATALAPVGLALGPALAGAGPLGSDPTTVLPDSECITPLIDDKCEAWTANPNPNLKMVVAPDSSLVFVDQKGAPTKQGVAAYDAKTGDHVWTSSNPGGIEEPDTNALVWEVAVSPDGQSIVATGSTKAQFSVSRDMLTSGFDAATGELLWVSSVEDSGGRAIGVAVGPDSEVAYVAGLGGALAYDLETGDELWHFTRDQMRENGSAAARGLLVEAAPDGETVYVAVGDRGTGPNRAIALDAGTGELVWDTPTATDSDAQYVLDFDLSSDGATLVLATGRPVGTVTAYDTATGELLWDTQMSTPPIISDAFVDPTGIAISPDSQTVYIQAANLHYLTEESGYVFAHDARTGTQRWTHMEPGGHHADWGSRAIDVSPDGSTVYTSFSARYGVPAGPDQLSNLRLDFATLALDAGTGERQWKAGVPASAPWVIPLGTHVAPDGSHVYALQFNSPSLVAYELDGSGGLIPPVGETPLTTATPALPTDQASSLDPDNLQLTQHLLDGLEDPTSSDREQVIQAARTALESRRGLAQEGPLASEAGPLLDRQHANLDLSEQLLAVNEDPQRSSLDKALDAATIALEDRRAMTQAEEGLLAGTDAPGLDQQAATIESARAMLEALDREHDSPLAESIAVAHLATRHQAESLGLAWGPAPAGPGHQSPAAAALDLIERHEATLTQEQADQVERLEQLPEPVRTSLTAFLNAFLAFDTAVQEAYDGADLKALEELPEPLEDPTELALEDARVLSDQEIRDRWETPGPVATAKAPVTPVLERSQDRGQALQAAGVDLAQVLPARSALLNAALDLRSTLHTPSFQSEPELGPNAVEPIHLDVPPAIALDFGVEDSSYQEDMALIVDGGGNDRYANNAGGSNLIGGACDAANATDAAALFDLGEGDDDYTSAKRGCGVRGGGYAGAGLLVDEGGSDLFAPYTPTGTASTSSNAGAPTTLASHGEATEPPSGAAGDGDLEDADSSQRYVVGLHQTPDTRTGIAFHGASILETNQQLDFLVVEPEDAATFLELAHLDPNVRYIHEDGQAHFAQAPDDPLYTDQYGPQQVNAPQAWETSMGDTTRAVCAVETGVDYTHPDLNGTRWLGGYDTAYEDPDPMEEDTGGHGTHVTGIAAATVNNGIGIAGTGNVGILVAKVSEAFNTYVSDVAEGIEWCADNGGDVISMSFLTAEDYEVVRDAVEYAWAEGSLLVGAAGNTGCFDCFYPPATYDEVISVACTDRAEDRCSFSTYGPGIELAAPGDEILSTAYHTVFSPPSYEDGYEVRSGTSMSAPHVSGVAALVWSQVPELTNTELRQLLRDTARDVGPPGCDELHGHGIVDAGAALQAALDGARPVLGELPACLSGGYFGSNGGGHAGGTGLLIAAGAGSDTYLAGGFGTNGGGAGGAGALIAGSGDDSFRAGERGVNGGGFSESGHGLLVDAGGANAYTALSYGTNGGGYTGGTGLLIDAGTETTTYSAGALGTNGGAAVGNTNRLRCLAPTTVCGDTLGNGIAGVIGSMSIGLLLDAGGDDQYTGDAGGTNGGAYHDAVGLLIDPSGDDTYGAERFGANGGGYGGAANGFGFLVDLDGEDTYTARHVATNGGGMNTGHGFLFDGSGNDVYMATEGAVNGGGAGEATGFLLDADGDNQFLAESGATNGGSAVTILSSTGGGFLFDAGTGNSIYEAGEVGTNGGGAPGVGMLLDAGGDDDYTATRFGTNGGGVRWGGMGFLIDGGGTDSYQATYWGTNGGGVDIGTGFLLDAGGDDTYDATYWGTNGGAWQIAAGFLLDTTGDDTYTATSTGTNGGGVEGVGFLFDGGGNDAYSATDDGTNGGGYLAGSGALLDMAGDDTYQAGTCGTNGGAAEGCFIFLGVDIGGGAGILLDGGGTDSYEDDAGACDDCTQAPKGTAGAQIDVGGGLIPMSLGSLGAVDEAPEGLEALEALQPEGPS